MQQVFKCGNCGGDKFKFVSNNAFKCAYCGQMTNVTPPQSQQIRQAPPMSYMPPMQQMPPQQNFAPNRPPQRIYPDVKSKTTAMVLAILLGGFGAHKFYLRDSGMGVLYILFCWTYIPGIIALIEFIVLATMSDQEFDVKYNPVA